MALMNNRKYFIHNTNGDCIVSCNEWNIEQEKQKLPIGKYTVIGQNVNYSFEIK